MPQQRLHCKIVWSSVFILINLIWIQDGMQGCTLYSVHGKWALPTLSTRIMDHVCSDLLLAPSYWFSLCLRMSEGGVERGHGGKGSGWGGDECQRWWRTDTNKCPRWWRTDTWCRGTVRKRGKKTSMREQRQHKTSLLPLGWVVSRCRVLTTDKSWDYLSPCGWSANSLCDILFTLAQFVGRDYMETCYGAAWWFMYKFKSLSGVFL